MKIRYEDGVELAAQLLQKSGLDESKAASVARALGLAEAWGLPSHGFLRLPIYLDRLDAGGYAADARLTTTTDLGALLVMDGGTGLGHWQLSEAVDLAVPRAEQFGLTAIAIGNSGHCGALGVYAADAAERGMVSLVFSCGPAALPPWGGTGKLLSTSPIAAGFPAAPKPIIIDLALSTVSRGKIAEYAARHEPLPEGWATDSAGTPTTDAQAALEGLLAPLGGAKGFALAFLVEALTAGLVGPQLSKNMPDIFDRDSLSEPQRISHLLVMIDPSRTDVSGDVDAPGQRLSELVAATAVGGGRAPGSRRFTPSEVHPGTLLEIDSGLLKRLEERA
ncbi:MAG: Ldh family oxidoreductase [Acidobacteria bacterium]|nr:Ldh family oxidoreductase [Acidobacteriota bacterium]